MKIFTKILTGVFATIGVVTLYSCDDIKESDRFIELPAVESKRVVLVEEFTGQNCSNCPEAHEQLKTMLDQYPENLIAVCIHGGKLAYSEDQLPKVGLANKDSETYYNNNSVSAPPAGVVNRSSGVVLKEQWPALIRTAIETPSKIDMDVTASVDADGSTITIYTTYEPHDNFDANLQLWVLESGIKSMQIGSNGIMFDYEHNHVLRGAVNGIDGESVKLVTRESKTVTHTAKVRNDDKAVWNVDNLSIVAFFYDKSGVLQAAQTKVKQ